MKKISKTLALILAMILLGSQAAACTKPDGTSAIPVTEEATSESSGSTVEFAETSEETSEEKTEESADAPETTTAESTAEETETETESQEETSSEDASEKVLREYRYEGLVMNVPADMEEADNSGIRLLVPSTYPYPSDNISFTVTETAEDVRGYYTADALRDLVNANYRPVFNTEVSNYSYQKDSETGIDRVVVRFDIQGEDVEMDQIIGVYFPEGKVITITYTNVSGEYRERFEDSLKSIRAEE